MAEPIVDGWQKARARTIRSDGALERAVDQRSGSMGDVVLLDPHWHLVDDLAPSTYQRCVKCPLDRLVAFALLIALAPLFLVVAVLVRLRLGRPVVFRQPRVGLHDEVFEILKFRTMRPDRRSAPTVQADVDRRCTHKSTDDPRHTPLGQFLRRYSLDELPQLVNVVRGEMALIGPRPELVEVVERYGLWGHPRNVVRPGITGVWQISPERNALLHENLDIDLAYLRRPTFTHDLTIAARTLVALTTRAGS